MTEPVSKPARMAAVKRDEFPDPRIWPRVEVSPHVTEEVRHIQGRGLEEDRYHDGSAEEIRSGEPS